jgi:class 3 adenylate cyclase
VEPIIAEHHGRVVKLMGDGALVVFASVVDAVACAIEIQTVMAKHDATLEDGRRIVFRIGINLGDVIVEGEDIYGDGVNVAARIEAMAEPGGVAVSETVVRADVPRARIPTASADCARWRDIPRDSDPITADCRMGVSVGP